MRLLLHPCQSWARVGLLTGRILLHQTAGREFLGGSSDITAANSALRLTDLQLKVGRGIQVRVNICLCLDLGNSIQAEGFTLSDYMAAA